MTSLSILVLLVHLSYAVDRVERQNQGFVQVTDSDKVAVQLQCAPKFMHVVLQLTQGPFYDYISIGQFGDRPECRFRGNGSTLYELQIHLMGDRCGTEMIAESGTFENVIRIGAHPTVVLDSDERVVVRCLYGPPKVDRHPHVLPPLLPAQPQVIVTSTLIPPLADSDNSVVDAGMENWHVILIVFLVLILALIFLLCGCLYFFFKRRKVLVEKRTKLLVPASGHHHGLHNHENSNKMDLWWPTTATSKVGVSNDALLSHDYMISSNSTREQLSVSVESPGGTQSTNSGGSGESDPRGSDTRQGYVHETKHMIPRAHGDMPVGRLVQSLQSIPEERLKASKSSQSTNGNETPVSYAKIEKTEIHSEQILHVHNIHPKNEIDDSKVAEIYRVPSETQKAETESISTLEGGQYAAGTNGLAITANDSTTKHYNEAELFNRAVTSNPGYGPHRLTDHDLKRWRTFVEKDTDLLAALSKARTLEDFECIARKQPFAGYFSKEKWSIVTQSLAHVTFMRKLSNIIDTRGQGEPGSKVDVLQPLHDIVKPSDASEYKPQSQQSNRLATVDSLAAEIRQKDQRLFTRDSYSRMKGEFTPPPKNHAPPVITTQKQSKFDSVRTVSSFGNTNDRSTTELAEPIPTITRHDPIHGPLGTLPRQHFRERSSSETFENPPQLSVYMGNVSNRDIHESIQHADLDSVYNAVPGIAMTSTDHLPSPPEGL